MIDSTEKRRAAIAELRAFVGAVGHHPGELAKSGVSFDLAGTRVRCERMVDEDRQRALMRGLSLSPEWAEELLIRLIVEAKACGESTDP